MPINYPGPFELRINYLTNEPAAIATHQLRISHLMSVEGDPGDPFSAWIPLQKNGSAVDTLADHTDDIVALLRPLYNTASDFVDAELWEYAPGTFDAIFRSSYAIGLAGSSGTATQNYGQCIITFRSATGGIAKLDLRGTILGFGVRLAFPTASTPLNNLAAALIGATSIMIARDNGYLIAHLFALIGQNERAWKVINR